ncbi:unnamed protein product [Paramecium pentaurelia]|uniref:WD40-repeat-containing domain n=1 Tax=Paramecium pentaurelia TaxID=43138 RepID=A0A8S1VMC9_9CILI|nr:unnamed protein product [Paramecium pentaurelia]
MYKPKMIENEKDLNCYMKHELPVTMIILDSKQNVNGRLLCQQCIDNNEFNFDKLFGLQKAINIMEDNRKNLLSNFENTITKNIKKVESLQMQINSLKSNLNQKLDYLLDITKNWIQNLEVIIQQYTEYSFFKEINLIIMNKQNKEDHKQFKNQINLLNDGWIKKIRNHFQFFKSFSEYEICNEILNNLNQSIQEQQQNQVTLQFIDDSIEQKEGCRAIVFDPKGKIMVSTSGKEIKIWNFDNGKINLIQTLQEHQEFVNCLVYSQIQQFFISGSSDKSIRLWKYVNNKWQSSKRYNEHKGMIYCVILTQKEDQLISSSNDKSIKIWMVDFNNDQLRFLYSLEKHTGIIYSLSLNQSEQIMVSSGVDQIIIWQNGKNNKWKFLQVVKQTLQEIGCHVKFLKENQFIWLPEKSNNLCVFEYQDGEFKENLYKRVCFQKNQGYLNEFNFPIIYNEDKNLICLRHLQHICLLKAQNDGQLQIIQEFDCKHQCIYGTITNNGQYLIFWGAEKNKYEIYEILNN